MDDRLTGLDVSLLANEGLFDDDCFHLFLDAVRSARDRAMDRLTPADLEDELTADQVLAALDDDHAELLAELPESA